MTPIPQTLGTTLLAAFDQAGTLTDAQREQLRERIEEIVHYQAVVGIMGKTGAGKSSLCNALFGQDVAEVDDVAGCTRYPQEFTLAYKNGKGIALIDLPGVGETTDKDSEYAALYQRLLPEMDLILWVIKADDRALSIDEHCYRTLIQPYLAQRDIPVLFVLSQVDKLEPYRDWDTVLHLPGTDQAKNLSRKQIQLSQVFDIPSPDLCHRRQRRLRPEHADRTDHCHPTQAKKWSIAREANPEVVSSTAYHSASKGLWESVKEAAQAVLSDSWNWVSNTVSSWVGKLFGW
jgi:small GTP-binding protein